MNIGRNRSSYIFLTFVGLMLVALPLALPEVRAGAVRQAQANGGVLGAGGQRGLTFVHTASAPFGSQASYDSLARLHKTGANWVSVVAPIRQSSANSTTFALIRSALDPTDAGLTAVIAYAHSLGMKVMFEPVVLADDGADSRGLAPQPASEWFDNYRQTLGDFADLARAAGAEEFCIGSRLSALTGPQYDPEWDQVITSVRQYYFGPITYSADWGATGDAEFARIGWWNRLDYIGIAAYFPASASASAQASISAVQTHWAKPVQFTQIGFASQPPSQQATSYDAIIQAWGRVPWLAGIFWSPWYSSPTAGGPFDTGESPQNKPAEGVLTRWYAGAAR
ncbi:MAG: glycoside hydrolase family 113 [Chloroflexia bacterium]